MCRTRETASEQRRSQKVHLLGRCTLAVEQEVAHVVAEGAADVGAAVGQGARQAAAVERAEGVGAAETKNNIFKTFPRI